MTNLSTEKSTEQAFCSTPPRKKLADHPFIKSVGSGQFTLLYGLEVHREAIRDKTFETLGAHVQSQSPPSMMGLSFRLFNTPPSDIATAAGSTTVSPDIPQNKP